VGRGISMGHVPARALPPEPDMRDEERDNRRRPRRPPDFLLNRTKSGVESLSALEKRLYVRVDLTDLAVDLIHIRHVSCSRSSVLGITLRGYFQHLLFRPT